MKPFRQSTLLVTGALALAAAAFAQSGPATNRSIPPAPPRPDAPINPDQNAVAEPAPTTPAQPALATTPAATAPAAGAAASPAPDAANPAAPATEQAPAPRAVRELVFAEADTDKDGRVSLHEYTTFVESRVETRSTETVREETIQRFLDLDHNNDAHLSQAEASSSPAAAPLQSQANPPPRVRR